LVARPEALVPPALLLFYVLAVDRLGFLPTAAVMVLITSLALVRGCASPSDGNWRAAVRQSGVLEALARALAVGILPLPWAGLP